MIKFTKRITAVLLICLVFCFSSVNAFAATTNRSILANILQNQCKEQEVDCTVTDLDQNLSQQLWNEKILNNENVIKFFKTIKSDGYEEIDEGEHPIFNANLKIEDHQDSSFMVYYFVKTYGNSSGNIILAMFCYEPKANSIMGICAYNLSTNEVCYNFVIPSEKASDILSKAERDRILKATTNSNQG